MKKFFLLFFVALAKKVKFSFQERHYEINHELFFFRLRAGYHDCECDERMVGDALRAVLAEKQLVALQEIEEQSGGDSLVTIREVVIFFVTRYSRFAAFSCEDG